MRISEKPPRYRTYLLTMWAERDQEIEANQGWRFKLEVSANRHQQVFANLEEMAAFLELEMDRIAEK